MDGDADGGEGGNYVRIFSVIPAVADLSVTMIVDNPAPSEGMNLQYTVTVSDLSGPATVTGLQVSDLLPAGLSFVGATASAGSYDSASGVWSINSLTLGGSEALRITAKIPVGLAFQTLTNTAALAFVDQGDTNAGNDAASVSFTVKPSADLALTISGGSSPREGDLQYYSLTIDNNAGPAAATGVQITDLLPVGLRFVSSSPESGTSYDPVTGIWTVGTLAKGASRTLQITTQIVGAAGQTVTNTARITAADQFDYKTNNNTVSTTATIVDAPLFASGKNITAVEGASFTQVVASFVDGDPTAQASYFTTTIQWGDSTSSAGTVAANAQGGFNVTGTHAYQRNGSNYSITVGINDYGSSTATAFSSANVSDAALHASGTTVRASAGSVFTAAVATFTDDNPFGVVGDFTATITWGDGTPASNGTISVNSGGGFKVNGTHSYAFESTFPIDVTIRDAGGATTTATEQRDCGTESECDRTAGDRPRRCVVLGPCRHF